MEKSNQLFLVEIVGAALLFALTTIGPVLRRIKGGPFSLLRQVTIRRTRIPNISSIWNTRMSKLRFVWIDHFWNPTGGNRGHL